MVGQPSMEPTVLRGARDSRHEEIRKLIIETNKTIISLQRSLIRLEAELNHSAA